MQKDRPFVIVVVVVVVVVVVAMLNFILSKYAFREVFEARSVRRVLPKNLCPGILKSPSLQTLST